MIKEEFNERIADLVGMKVRTSPRVGKKKVHTIETLRKE